MKKFFYLALFSLLLLFSKSASASFQLPTNVPYLDSGVTYNNTIATYDSTNDTTTIFYCSQGSDLTVNLQSDIYVNLRCKDNFAPYDYYLKQVGLNGSGEIIGGDVSHYTDSGGVTSGTTLRESISASNTLTTVDILDHDSPYTVLFPQNLTVFAPFNTPIINSIMPLAVQREGNEPITILGENFDSDIDIEMCGSPADLISHNETEIKFLSTSCYYSSASVVVNFNDSEISMYRIIEISDGMPVPPEGDDTTINYDTMPSFLDSPTEWVSALFHNFGIWVSSVFIPRPYFMTYQMDLLNYNLNATFSVYNELKETFENGNDTIVDGQTGLNIPTLNLFDSGDIPIIDTTQVDDIMPTVKGWIVVFFYFYTAIFTFRSIYQLFHPGQIKMDI